MRLTPRAVVLVFIGIAVAMLLRPVEAQTESSPYQLGQRLQMSYTDRTVDCTLAEVHGAFVRCEPGKPDAFSRGALAATWYNTASTVFISVREK
jgi:hypothetical protein